VNLGGINPTVRKGGEGKVDTTQGREEKGTGVNEKGEQKRKKREKSHEVQGVETR